MVQWGILLIVVVMKINRKKVVPSIHGGLLWRVPGGTSADRYRVPRSTLCRWILLVLLVTYHYTIEAFRCERSLPLNFDYVCL